MAKADPDTDLDPVAVRDRLARFVGKICPEWLRSSREDLVQTAYLKLLQIRKRGDNNPVPSTSYLWKVAYSTTIDEIRRRRPGRETSVEESGVEQQAQGTDPFDLHAMGELSRALRECLGQLAEGRRLAVFYHLMGHSLAEQERLTGWSGYRVRNLLYRGLGDLRACLTRKGFQP